MSSVLKRVLSAGAHDAGSRSKIRSIQLTNSIAFISAFLFLVLITYLAVNNGFSTVVRVGCCTIVTLLAVIYLNQVRLYDLSRGVISLLIPVSVLAAIFLSRISLIGRYHYS